MSLPTPSHEWWSADELAASELPDIPTTKRRVNALAERQNWRGQIGLARKRKGRGGGWEYSWKLLPARAQQKLAASEAISRPGEKASIPDRDEAWEWFDGLPESVKTRSHERLETIQKVEALETALGRDLAIRQVGRLAGIGGRTIWTWFAMIEGVRPEDRLAYLAPRHRAASTRGRSLECDPAFFDYIKSDFLRNEQPSFSSCYRRALRVAKAKGWDTLPERTMRRRLDADVSAPLQILARKGIDAVKRYYPTQVRDKTALVALEAVNADFHKFDVFVRWPAVPGEKPLIGRPQMVAFQDIYSGRVLAWRVDVSPNSTAVLLAAGDMIESWGIPSHVLLDNGREFAAKAITGGASTRYRFKVKEDDIPGLFTALGCQIHWATPYSGQSKPIERAFRDMCDAIAKDPRFEGAWTGNRPEAKPENYGKAAIDLDAFLKVVAEGIEEHNTREGRRSVIAVGRSFAEVFDESYAAAPIRKATAAQRRLWLLGAEGLRADTASGVLRFMGNEFWADWMHQVAGQRVIGRFDPADLWSGLHVYSQDNAYLGHAPCRVKAGFFDMDEARTHSRARNAWLAAEKKALQAHRRFQATELADALDGIAPADLAKPEAKVVRPVFSGPKDRPAAPTPSQDVERMQAAIVADLSARRTPREGDETPRERFKQALDLERAIENERDLTSAQLEWLSVYRTTPEYRAERSLWEDMGDAIFG